MVERVDVVVVGTGWNGLINAKTYLEFEPNANLVLLDDQASIGGVWSAEKIYPTLYAQIKYGLFEYSFYPMRREGVTSDGYISGHTINQYLNEFAQEYGLASRTRFSHKVTNVEKLQGKEGWKIHIEGKQTIECARLIYASGATSHPVVPSWPQSSTFNVPVIHSSDTGTHLQALKGINRATVVGSAKSAYDTVFLLLQYGVQVNWVMRGDGSGPMAIMPPTIFGLLNSMDVISTKAMAKLGSSIMSTKGMVHQFFQRTWLGRGVANIFWRAVNKIAEMHAEYDKSDAARQLKPLPHGNGIFWANAGLGCASVPDFWKVFHAGDCTIHKTEIEALSGEQNVILRNGAHFKTDYIILCTGFDKSYHTFSPELQQTCGLAPDPMETDKWTQLEEAAEATIDLLLPTLKHSSVFSLGHEKAEKARSGHRDKTEKLLHGPSLHYRRLIAPGLADQNDRSIYFPGFIHTIYTPLVSEVQALWGVSFMLGLLDVPSREKMDQEVAEWNVWSRKRYNAQGKKHAYAIFDFLPYIDMLLDDLGIKKARTGNLLSEFFLPAYPRNYRGLVAEFKSAYDKRQALHTSDL